MSQCDSPYLTTYEPIVEALITLTWGHEGWSIRLNHRHWSGRLGQCGVEEYTKLSMGELHDVFCAVTAGWGPAGAELRRLGAPDLEAGD